ncbi:Spy/CpxP family protein refolding chaperone [Algoriphagus sediminis]|uniref:Periplasmic heavy metal sensor n=1 Tax=Algoriphagus sediminis TaxID=3057113 RepID=A0ABT7YFH8_9BACT|nr:periplasmic heavy metal sensor [Algoriphagus sediminis]MDN3205277.1 periplasmic heavy metal sensor [Algoriphagus sediminis]
MKKLALILYLSLFTGMGFAQKAMTWTSASSSKPEDIFTSNLYSADRVMEMRDKLDLTDAQASKIKKIHAESAGEFSTMKWDLDEETKKLNAMLEANSPNSSEVDKQMDKVLALESKLKKKRLSTLVAIKNELTEEQIEMLKSRLTVATGSYVFNSASNSKGATTVIGYPMNFQSKSGATTLFPDSKNSKIMIRMDSDEDGSKPLFVVNLGEETVKGNSISDFDINPDDIQSISVLKDKSATSLYGDEGKDGVVIITLKDGAKIKKNKK